MPGCPLPPGVCPFSSHAFRNAGRAVDIEARAHTLHPDARCTSEPTMRRDTAGQPVDFHGIDFDDRPPS